VLSQFGIEASRAAQYVIAFAIILVLVALFGLVLRKLTGSRLMMNGQDRSRARQPRLGVVDIYDLDRQRQLVLLRRDNVEHLLLIGGLNDVVIETNIVRVAGARIPAPEQGAERFEPAFEPTRPQVETPARPSIETQLAAQLGTFMRRPSDETTDEAPPVVPPEAARPEPVFRTAIQSAAAPAAEEPRPEPAPSVRPEPRPSYMPPMFQSRPTPMPAPAAPPISTPPMPPPPVAPPAPPAFPAEPVRAVDEAPAERAAPDAAILSDMAKQLEEALKRPATPLSPSDERAEIASSAIEDNSHLGGDEDDDLLEPMPDHGREAAPPVAYGEQDDEDDHSVLVEADEGERERQPVEPAPAPAGSPAAAPPLKPAEKVADPFSVEEIEAEFARLLGRPLDTGKKG